MENEEKEELEQPTTKYMGEVTEPEKMEEQVHHNATPTQLLARFLERENLTIQAIPQWMPRDDGTFSLVVKVGVIPRPKVQD